MATFFTICLTLGPSFFLIVVLSYFLINLLHKQLTLNRELLDRRINYSQPNTILQYPQKLDKIANSLLAEGFELLAAGEEVYPTYKSLTKPPLLFFTYVPDPSIVATISVAANRATSVLATYFPDNEGVCTFFELGQRVMFAPKRSKLKVIFVRGDIRKALPLHKKAVAELTSLNKQPLNIHDIQSLEAIDQQMLPTYHQNQTRILRAAFLVAILALGFFTFIPIFYLTTRWDRFMELELGPIPNLISFVMSLIPFSYVVLLYWRFIQSTKSYNHSR